jgi:hypothetical protein
LFQNHAFFALLVAGVKSEKYYENGLDSARGGREQLQEVGKATIFIVQYKLNATNVSHENVGGAQAAP